MSDGATGFRFPLSLPSPALLVRRLDAQRMRALPQLLAARATQVREAREACAALWRDPGADVGDTLDTIARSLLAELRATGGALARLDAGVRSERQEILDHHAVPASLRRFTMRLLAYVNERLGSYPMWTGAITHALAGASVAHVEDLASGTGAFLRWLAEHPPRGFALTLTSSDLDPDYLAVGEAAAAASGSDVRFAIRNALDLRPASGVDLFLCTQATHHLGPGQVVRMISQATFAAPRGILIVDLLRSLAIAISAVVTTSSIMPFPVLVADGVQSVRRAYLPSELALLAELAGAAHVEARPFGPAHVTLHAAGRAA